MTTKVMVIMNPGTSEYWSALDATNCFFEILDRYLAKYQIPVFMGKYI